MRWGCRAKHGRRSCPRLGVEALDIPAAAAEISARAFRSYRTRRKRTSGKDTSTVPLPDFFIGAHAQIMGWTLATADEDRYRAYFPKSD